MEGVLKARKSSSNINGVVAIGLVLLVISSVFVEKSEAKFNIGCFIRCVAVCAPFKNPFICAGDCAVECFIKKKPPLDADDATSLKDDDDDDPRQLCQIGCAVSVCPRFITRDHSDTEKVKKCANSCGTTCSKNYLSP